MVEPPRKNQIMRFYTEKKSKTKIEFSGFERNLLLDPLKLTEENEIISLFNKIQDKLNMLVEVSNNSVFFSVTNQLNLLSQSMKNQKKTLQNST
jgi:hypothetical protein